MIQFRYFDPSQLERFRHLQRQAYTILVVTESDTYYLDDELPHHRRWRAA
ncbi:MAG: hypothetical protein ACREI8_07775 [Myxococcota bacterium]